MNASEPVATPERTKGASAAAHSSARSRSCRARYATLTLRIVALCFCFLTFVQLASALRSTGTGASPGVISYGFTHFPYEEVGSNAAGAFRPSVLQFWQVVVSVLPQQCPPWSRARLCAFVRPQPFTLVQRKILPSSSNDDP
jgi:hypothetical protein